MITDILIKNFKCFKQLTIPDLGRITLVAGKNNVGKSALIESLFLFCDRRRPEMILRQYGWRGITMVPVTPEAMWAPLFRDYQYKTSEILLAFTIDGRPEHAKFRLNENFTPPSQSVAPPPEQQVATTEEPSGRFAIDIEYSRNGTSQMSHLFVDDQGKPSLWVEDLKLSSVPANFFPSKLHLPSNEIASWFSALATENREGEALKFLQLIEPRLEALKIITEGQSSSVHGKLAGVSRTLPVNLMGEGVEKLLGIIAVVIHSPNRLILIDEIENGLHYSILPAVWKALGQAAREYNAQIVATTHSYECLRAAHEGLSEMPEDFRYIRLDRKDDEISAKLSNHEMVGAALKTNLEIR